MKNLVVRVFLVIALSVSAVSGSLGADQQHFAAGATFQTCFTPGADCEALIEQAINAAGRRVHLQAYFSPTEILPAPWPTPVAAVLSRASRQAPATRA